MPVFWDGRINEDLSFEEIILAILKDLGGKFQLGEPRIGFSVKAKNAGDIGHVNASLELQANRTLGCDQPHVETVNLFIGGFDGWKQKEILERGSCRRRSATGWERTKQCGVKREWWGRSNK